MGQTSGQGRDSDNTCMSSSYCAPLPKLRAWKRAAMTAFPLTVVVTPNAVQIKPGGTAQISVDVKNVSDIVQHYQVTIVGLPSNDYWASEPAVTKLRPGESGTIRSGDQAPAEGWRPRRTHCPRRAGHLPVSAGRLPVS